MKIYTLLFAVFFIVCKQKDMIKIQVNEGLSDVIHYEDLRISTNLLVYDEKSAPHLVGDVSLDVKDNDNLITCFYINGDKSGKEYDTRMYKNYFLTFDVNNDRYNLNIEHAKFGKSFALRDSGSFTIENEDVLELEITDYYHEYGNQAPIGNENGVSFDDVNYTIKVKTKNLEKHFSFYSSELNGNYSIDVGNYDIVILSDRYHDKYCFIEMIINKKEDK